MRKLADALEGLQDAVHVASWSSVGSRYWLVLYRQRNGFGIRTEFGAAWLGLVPQPEAFRQAELRVQNYKIVDGITLIPLSK